MVLAEDPATAGEGVLVEGAGPLVLTQPAQVDGEVVGRAEGVGVVLAQDPAAAGEGVLVEVAGPLRSSPNAAGRRRGCWPSSRVSGWSSPRTRRRRVEGVLVEGAGPLVAHPLRTGRRRGCWPRRGCRGGPRPGPAGGGRGCPRRGRGPAGAHPRVQVGARLLAEVRVSGWSSPRTRRRRARVSSSRVRACW